MRTLKVTLGVGSSRFKHHTALHRLSSPNQTRNLSNLWRPLVFTSSHQKTTIAHLFAIFNQRKMQSTFQSLIVPITSSASKWRTRNTKKLEVFTYKQFLPILFLTIATISRDKMGAQSQGNLATADPSVYVLLRAAAAAHWRRQRQQTTSPQKATHKTRRAQINCKLTQSRLTLPERTEPRLAHNVRNVSRRNIKLRPAAQPATPSQDPCQSNNASSRTRQADQRDGCAGQRFASFPIISLRSAHVGHSNANN